MSDLAWLNGRPQPRIFGNYEKIRRDYLIREFIDDVTPSEVVGSVYIQVNWPEGREVFEAEWVQEIALDFGWPNALIGYVNFASDGCAKTLKKMARLPLMRGIRQQLHWHKNPLYKFANRPDIMMEKQWRTNFSLLQDYDWLFELQIFPSQMKDAARFASDFIRIPMVLQHCGMPEDTSVIGIENWLEGMKQLADQPNVHCKLSGLGTFIHENSNDFIRDIVEQCLELFGPRRCIFGSNFPIEKIWTSYSDLINGYKKALNNLSQQEQNLVFYSNAKELYKL